MRPPHQSDSYSRDRRDLRWRGRRSLEENLLRKYGRALVAAGLLIALWLLAQLGAWLDSGGLRQKVAHPVPQGGVAYPEGEARR